MDLSQVVLGYSLKDAEEVALTGGGSLAARAQRLRWTTAAADTAAADAAAETAAETAAESNGGVDNGEGKPPPASNDDYDWRVTLGPMEIKTYRLELDADR